jgi:hypothetical protein
MPPQPTTDGAGVLIGSALPCPIALPATFVQLSPVQRAAHELYAMGFSVGPTRPASKFPYKWRRLYTARIDPARIVDLFPGRSGLFVVTGAISRNLTILDCESASVARAHAAEFARRGLHPWRVETARGAHFWWLSADGELANMPDDPKHPRGWELRGRCLYVLCPPSIHPTGVIYDWAQREGPEPPTIALAALDWLGARPHLRTREVPRPSESAPEAYPELSRANREFILNGATEGTRNNRLFAAACDLQGNGYSLADARAALLPTATRCGLPEKQTTATINSAYKAQRAPAKQTKAPPPMAPWARARLWADTFTFSKMTATTRRRRAVSISAPTARAVFIALCERARCEHPATAFRASVRELAELAHLRRDTVQAALACMLEAGWLRHCGLNTVGAGLFAFDVNLFQKRASTLHWTQGTGPLLEQTVWARGGLGDTPRRVWAVILNGSKRAADVARLAGVSRQSAGRALAALRDHGLAEQTGRLWEGLAAGRAELEHIAATLGVNDRDEKRRALHNRQRAADVTAAILGSMRRQAEGMADVE